ncbi:MAG: flagellar basal body L-ring protein FlgH [Sneathiella sp.]|uniref:flagellar basal body L-ring protein FlgH n=1 Tax=Sneathiella sp. TaxID=1964365 RepID=UPI003002B483
MTHIIDITTRVSLILLLATVLAGCNFFDRLANVGSEPPLTEIVNPVIQKGYQPVSMPMPRPQPVIQQANSLWRPGSKAFFKDQRASQVGDIVTVLVEIDDDASLNNSTDTSRVSNEEAGFTGFLGLESQITKVLPEGTTSDGLIDLGSDSSVSGSGTVDRNEKINMEIAAIVTQILPNGNLVIIGRQEVRVNFESRDLSVTGVVRPEDITSSNTIESAKIAEARIAYGGRGHLTDVQQGRYGQQLFDIIFPW